MSYNPEIFKAYDIRGIHQADFDNDFAYQLGAAVVRYLKPGNKPILIGHDSREFSVDLSEAVMAGIQAAGGRVKYLGLATTPFFNFVLHKLGCAGGNMITASHNAPIYAGFKLYGQKGMAIGLESGLQTIRQLIDQPIPHTKSAYDQAKSDRLELLNEYIRFIMRKAKISKGELDNLKFKISGLGAVTEEIKCLNENINLAQFSKGFQIGFSFDEDADRLAVIDATDQPIRLDYLVGVLVKDMIRFLSKPRVVYDLRFSRGVLGKFGEWGIKYIKSRVGRVYIRDSMVKQRADIGGELSGHIYFKEANYNELPLLAMLKILKIMARSKMEITELIQPFQTWHNVPEINFNLTNMNQLHESFPKLAQQLKERYPETESDEVDGLSVIAADWWCNLRPSNTEPLLRLIVEAKEKNLLQEKVDELQTLITNGVHPN